MCVRLPIWRRGCGIRSRLSLAPAAFCSTAALPSVLHAIASSTTRMADGVTRTNLTTIQTHQHTRTTARRPIRGPRPCDTVRHPSRRGGARMKYGG